MGSFGTGMASLNLDMANHPARDGTDTEPAYMGLRVSSSLLLGVLAVGYPFWFLNQARKARRFIAGGVCVGAVCWLIARLHDSGAGNAEDRRGPGSDYIWLDKLNFFGWLAVIVGILNAERSLFSSSEADDDTGDTERQGRGRRRRGQAEEGNRPDGAILDVVMAAGSLSGVVGA